MKTVLTIIGKDAFEIVDHFNQLKELIVCERQKEGTLLDGWSLRDIEDDEETGLVNFK